MPVAITRMMTLALVFMIVQGSIGAGQQPPASLMGFATSRVEDQLALEKKFDGVLKKENLRSWMKRLTARPHHTGSAYGRQNAEFIASQFKSWGYDTKLEEYFVLFPTPKSRLLEMISPTFFTATLSEPGLSEDSTSGQSSEQLPTYNAYSIDGDVTGELVYVNYGVPKDYEELERHGIDVRGKIVIARYGGSWRGIKPKVAAEHGAIGCIIYSDPKNDGYFEGDDYPRGPYRNDRGVQRGSVADMPIHSGDPLTPFIAATKDAKRLSLKDAETLTKIPVLPISYSDATPLLKALEGAVVPEGWRGALPFTYHFGPGKTVVHLKLAFNWDIVPIYDVIAMLKGSERPDEWIIRGNHHDAWVNGADDPISGMVATMEEARGIGELVRQGWKPKRSIVYAAWDAEEQGLLGSTEWVEEHADALKQKAVVYINSDSNGRGFLSMSGSHTLEKFMNQVASGVTDPQKGISVLDRARARGLVNGSAEEKRELRERFDLRLGALGSGSDFTPFLQHLGVAALNIGFGGEDGGGSYHSIYDSFDHYTRFGDPTFEYGIALAQTGGRAVLRLAQADVLPFEFTNFSETVETYIKEVAKLADDMRAETDERNWLVAEKRFDAASDPLEKYVPPAATSTVPYLNFAPLYNALGVLQERVKAHDGASRNLFDRVLTIPKDRLARLDAILMQMERTLTRTEGLPRRPWFIHHLYAPGMYTGYGVKTLPGVREAIELRKWSEAEEQIGIASRLIENVAVEIAKATELIHEPAGTK